MKGAALTRAAGIVAFLTVVSRVSGFFRETSLAAVFGAMRGVDAYLMAQVIPLLFLEIISYALTTTFIPVYSQVRAGKGQDAAFRMANAVFMVIVALGVLLVILGESLAHPLASLVAPGFDSSSLKLTAYLSRIIFPMVIFRLLSGVVTGILHAHEKFAIPEMAGLIRNLSIIAATITFGPRYGITATAVGLLLGVVASLLAKLPALLRIGFRFNWVFNLDDPGLRRMLVLVIPAIVGAGTEQFNVLIDRILASGLPEGRMAALNYAVRLNVLVPGILGNSIITVVYPTLASMASRASWKSFSQTLVRTLGLIHFFLVPVATCAIILREPLVRIVYERGAFDPAATRETSWALLFLAVGMAFSTMQLLLARAFFAFQDTKTPMQIGLATVAVNIIANLLLVGALQQGGLALGTSLAGLFGLCLSVTIMRRKVPSGLPLRQLLQSIGAALLASIVMGFTMWAAYPQVRKAFLNGGGIGQLASIVATGGLGFVVYGAGVWLLRIPEPRLAIGLLRRFKRSAF